MNLFDLVAGFVLLISALIGLSRGVVLELVALFAFSAATALSVSLLPVSAPLVAHSIHQPWAAKAAAVAGVFVVAYFGVRLLGSHISRSLRNQSTLGTLDRTVGLAFGVVRALVVLGVVYLVFSAAPLAKPPPLLTQARLYPLARGAGLTLASLAPGGLQGMEGFGAGLTSRFGGQFGTDAAGQEVDQDAAVPPSAEPPEAYTAAPHRHHRRPAPAQVE